MWLKINKNGQVEFYHDPKEVVTIMMMISREKV